MLRIYYLKIKSVDGKDTIEGIQYIHNAVLDQEGTLRKLIQDTTDSEHIELIKVASSWRVPNQEEAEKFDAFLKEHPVIVDTLKEQWQSATTTTQKLSIIAKRLGLE